MLVFPKEKKVDTLTLETALELLATKATTKKRQPANQPKVKLLVKIQNQQPTVKTNNGLTGLKL